MGFVMAALAAVWLGILTSMSPCPLATNIAAISFIGRRLGNVRFILLSGFLYAAGRTLAYVGLGIMLLSGMLAVPGVALGLQKHMNIILGPLLMIAGVLVLGVIPLNISFSKLIVYLQNKADSLGLGGAFVLGILFALSFCPVSAGLYFGSLIPLSMTQGSKIIFPGLFGIGTAIPVIGFAFVLSFGANTISRWFNAATQFEKWARWVTATIFMGVGFYFTWAYIFKSGR